MSEIEKLLYGNFGYHGIVEFTILPSLIRLRVVPWERPEVSTTAVFRNARLSSVEAYPTNPTDLDLPWDVIGFDCYVLRHGFWRFVVHCDSIEWCFESAWPVIERAEG